MDQDQPKSDSENSVDEPNNIEPKEEIPKFIVSGMFHIILALSTMYMTMLLTDWGDTRNNVHRVGTGVTSMWIRIVAQWLCGVLYVWTLVAPKLLPNRDFI